MSKKLVSHNDLIPRKNHGPPAYDHDHGAHFEGFG